MKPLKLLGMASVFGALLQGGAAWGMCSPIVIDLNGNGIKLGEAGIGVHFDVNADGVREHVQWVRPGGDEAFLALDRTGNGLVDDGSELFGVGTPLVLEGRNAPNGFIGLAQYDLRQLGGNDDGLITAADAIWPQLRLWLDLNADGVANREEMRTLRSVGITSLDTIPRVRRYMDDAGNLIPYWGWATRSFIAGQQTAGRSLMVDVFFRLVR
jgi:hypothetical protein